MSDEEVRELEREILATPAVLDLRRRHARLLLRHGEEDRGLGALDLAWRLGADELWDELRERLEKRRRQVRGITLCYVPGGPFAMGSDKLDADMRPAHLVWLSAFYVARDPLRWAALDGWRGHWPPKSGPHRERALQSAVIVGHTDAIQAVAYLNRAAPLDGLAGKWSLVSEAQWERAFRASHLRADGESPYGVEMPAPAPTATPPEWTADHYDPAAYDGGPRRDPLVKGTADQPRVIRGIASLPPPYFALYRDAARDDGAFEVGGSLLTSLARTGIGITLRPVFVPA